MASYVVMEKPDAAGDDIRFVRDGFHVFAFLIPVVWLLWHRLWIEAFLAFAAMAVLSALGTVAGFGAAAPLLSLLVSIYFGLEAANLRIAALRRRGWREWGVVEAANPAEAEMRHAVEEEVRPRPPEPAPPAPLLSSPSIPRPSGPALGMLGYPGRG